MDGDPRDGGPELADERRQPDRERLRDGAAPSAERATYAATSSLLWSLGWVIAGPWYAILQKTLGFDAGYTVNFVTIIVLYSLGTWLYWRWFHPVEAPPASR